MPNQYSRKQQLLKVCRYARIYGPRRTLRKALGRYRRRIPAWFSRRAKVQDIVLAGCGQFGFATIGYFVEKNLGKRFLSAYDIDADKSRTFSALYRTPRAVTSFQALIEPAEAHYLYIASNHHSHADYAVAGLARGLSVYVEKPVAVTYEQLARLSRSARGCEERIHAGYNRPFSGAVRALKGYVLEEKESRFSIGMFISGHVIESDHWYRDPQEGTRVCGNLGHWLDLAVHVLSWRRLPDKMTIQIAFSDRSTPDDNFVVTLTSEMGDVVSILLTARGEPFEGINETINFQYGDVIAKIDDFRTMVVWRRHELKRFRYWPKDVGHERAIMQPFAAAGRAWREVELSTLLMLNVKDMVLARETAREFSFADCWQKMVLTHSS